jgi:hypothetical protein
MAGKGIPGNAIGDSFLNKCFETISLFDTLYRARSRSSLFGWSEPFPLVVSDLLLLIILPSIFAIPTIRLKVSRLYNSTRLGLMVVLHQICYSYSIAMPLKLIIFQGTPCIHSTTFGRVQHVLQFPSSILFSGASFFFSVAKLSGYTSLQSKLLITVILFLIALTEVAASQGSVLQTTSAIFFAYIFHFIGFRVPFRLCHIENTILTLFVLAGMLAAIAHGWKAMQAFSEMWFSWVVIGIDELILARYHFTREGFKTVERPFDLSWGVDDRQTQTLQLLNSEDEVDFPEHCRSDLITSVIAFVVLFIGMVIRTIMEPLFFLTPD